jgi:hypothetical protein
MRVFLFSGIFSVVLVVLSFSDYKKRRWRSFFSSGIVIFGKLLFVLVLCFRIVFTFWPQHLCNYFTLNNLVLINILKINLVIYHFKFIATHFHFIKLVLVNIYILIINLSPSAGVT